MGHLKGRATRILGIATVSSIALLAAACSDSTEETNPGGGDVDTGPKIPTTPADATATDMVFAVDQFFIGETDWSATRDDQAWKLFGANVDNLVSTKLDANHCQFRAGAGDHIKIDGENGLDNSFGQNITPFINTLAPNPTASINESLADGDFTTLLLVRAINAAGEQGGISGGLYAAASIELPVWDGSDVWPVYSSSTTSDNIDAPATAFDASWVLDDTWNSGRTESMVIPIVVSGAIFPINLSHASITMTFNAERTEVTKGIISGIINPDEFIEELKSVVGGLDEALCEGSLIDNVASQIRQAPDIMKDSTNGDPSVTCNAISIGLGFTAKRANLGDVVPDPEIDNPCAE